MIHVLTGGPCSGKTTLLNELEKEGFKIIKEAAREIISEEKSLNPNFLSWNNLEEFQLKVLERQIEIERNLENSKETIFSDSAIPSGIAYLKTHNKNIPEKLLRESSKKRYGKIFLLEPIEKYENDSERAESKEISEKIHAFIKETYSSLGYELIEIPAVTPEERVKLIKANLNT